MSEDIKGRNMSRLQYEESQKGAVFVEATISLSIFMFTIFMILNIAQMAYAQERMCLGLDLTAKEIAEFSNVAYSTGVSQTFSGSGGKSSEWANKAAEFIEKIGNAIGSKTITSAGQALEGDSISSIMTQLGGVALASKLLEKNVAPDGDYDAFLQRNHISSVNLLNSRFENQDVFLEMTMKIKVVQFLNVDYEFTLGHCSYARVWYGEHNSKKE